VNLGFCNTKKMDENCEEAMQRIAESAQSGLLPEADVVIAEETKDTIKNSLTCVVCFELFLEPITLMCQHTFCKGCLKVPDFNICPSCRLKSFVPPQRNIILDDIVQQLFPEIYKHRKVTLEKQEQEKKVQAEDQKKENDIRNRFWRDMVSASMAHMHQMHPPQQVEHIVYPMVNQQFDPMIQQPIVEEYPLGISPRNNQQPLNNYWDYYDDCGFRHPCKNIFSYIITMLKVNCKRNQVNICCISCITALVLATCINIYLDHKLKVALVRKTFVKK